MSQKEKVGTAATKTQTQEQAISQENLKNMTFATPKPGETVTMAEAKKMTRTKSYEDARALIQMRGLPHRQTPGQHSALARPHRTATPGGCTRQRSLAVRVT